MLEQLEPAISNEFSPRIGDLASFAAVHESVAGRYCCRSRLLPGHAEQKSLSMPKMKRPPAEAASTR